MTTAIAHCDDNFIPVKEAAARAEVSTKTILRWMRCGFFGSRRKDRRARLVNEAEFDRYLADLTAPVSQSST